MLKVYSNIQKASNVMFYENIPSVYIFLGEVLKREGQQQYDDEERYSASRTAGES